jgi:hypothetical protein
MRPVQPSVVAAPHHVMLSAVPSSGKVNTMIRITVITIGRMADQDQRNAQQGKEPSAI